MRQLFYYKMRQKFIIKVFFLLQNATVLLQNATTLLQNTTVIIKYDVYYKVFLEVSQNSQENNFARVSFLKKLQTSAYNFIKKEVLP